MRGLAIPVANGFSFISTEYGLDARDWPRSMRSWNEVRYWSPTVGAQVPRTLNARGQIVRAWSRRLRVTCVSLSPTGFGSIDLPAEYNLLNNRLIAQYTLTA